MGERAMTVTPPPAPPLPAELDRLLRRLRLPYIRRAAPEVIATATSQRWEHAEVLRVLLAEEAAGRDHATISIAAAEPAGGPVRETRGWVCEADPLLAREVEEVAQRSESEPAVTASGEERVDIGARAGRPVADAVLIKTGREVSENGEALLDRVVFEGSLADPSGALLTGEQPGEVALGGGAQRRRAALDSALASTVSEATLLVAGEHQAFGDEERLEQPGGVSRAAAGPTAVRYGRDQRSRSLDAGVQRALEPAQVSPGDAGGAPLEQPAGERAEPWRALLTESIFRAVDPHLDD
jgi:hypothetical protein